MTTESKRPIAAEDLYQIDVLNDIQITPDGKSIIFSLMEINRENEKKSNHLWVVPTQGGCPRQLTTGKQKDSKPKVSPDGQWVAFISNRLDKKQPQMFLLPLNGGEAWPLTDFQGDFGSFDWSPDSRNIVFQFRQHDQEDIEIREDQKKKELGRVARRIDHRVFFKLDGYGYLPDAHFHLWTVNIETKKTQQITPTTNFDENGPAWSPDGHQIAFLSNRTENPDLNPQKTDIYLLNLESEKFDVIPTPEGPKGSLSFSPDGKHLAYIGHEGVKAGYKNGELWLIDLSTYSVQSITADYDFNVGGSVINDIETMHTVAPIWSPDSKKVFFQVGKHGRVSFHAINLENNILETVLKFDGVVSAPTLDQSASQLAFIRGTMEDPGQVCVYNFETEEIDQLTMLNKALFDQIDLGTYEEVWFKGADNNDLQGWIIKPPNFNPENKYPSIMEIHGGPLTQYGFLFMHEFFYLAAKGYVVYFCNPRGGQGYGEDHAKAIYHGKWGTVDYEDLMIWADYVQNLDYIDADKMGVTGGSYGGYMTVWIIGHTDRFKAAAAQRCVSNLISMWGSSDFNWSFQAIFDDKAPFENLDVLWQCSPIKHIGSAKTPTLIIHSMQDLRCAIEQSEQVYVALKNLNVDTAFLIFPDSPHGVSRSGRTDRRIVRLESILQWFERYLN